MERKVNILKNEDDNVIDFKDIKGRLALAGGEPPDPYGPYWLKHKPVGSVFYVKPKRTTDFQVTLFTVLDKSEKTVVLGTFAATGQHLRVPVDPIAFCNHHSLHEDLGVIVTEETQEINELNDEISLDKPEEKE